MADDPIQTPEDAKEQRDDAFFSSFGIDRGLYFFSIRNAVLHARGAPKDLNTVPWRLWGARNIGGRIRALVQNPRNPQLLYAGSAQGGVFKSTDAGDTWLPLGGPENAFPVGALGIAPSNPNVLYIGTGEPGTGHTASGSPPALRARQLFASGVGLIRFDESAPAFPVPELGTGANGFFRIVVDPNDASGDRCWIACHTGLWRREAGPSYTRELVNPPLPAPPDPGACATDVVVTDNGDGSYRILAIDSSWPCTAAACTPATSRPPRRPHRLIRRVAPRIVSLSGSTSSRTG